MKKVKGWYSDFKKLSFIEQIAIVLVLWWVYKFVRKYVDSISNNATIKGQQAADSGLSTSTGVSKERIEILRGLGYDLQSALWDWKNRWPFGWQKQFYEDEDEVIAIINGCLSVTEVRLLSQFFMEAYPSGLPNEHKKTLKWSVEDLLTPGEQQDIKSTYRAALK